MPNTQIEHESKASAEESRLRRLWRRLEWNPWFWFTGIFLIFVGFGRGSLTSLIAGTATGLVYAGSVALTLWAYRRISQEWIFRGLRALLLVPMYFSVVLGGRWMMSYPFDWVNILGGAGGCLIILIPAAYFHDLPEPKVRPTKDQS